MGKFALALLYGAVIAILIYAFSDKIALYLGFANEAGAPVTNAVLGGVLAGFALMRPGLFAALWAVLVGVTVALIAGRGYLLEHFNVSLSLQPLIGVVVSMVFLALPFGATTLAGMTSQASDAHANH
jgi:hypothetical protein